MHESSEVRLVKWHRKTYSKSEPEKNIYLCLASQKIIIAFLSYLLQILLFQHFCLFYFYLLQILS